MNKRGQFYLIAAVVVISLIISINIIYNIADSSKEDTQIIDLSDEITFESSQIIDNGVFTDNKGKIPESIESLSNTYASKNLGKDLIFIVGNKTEFNVFYQDAGKKESLQFPGTTLIFSETISNPPGSVSLSTSGDSSLDLSKTILKKEKRITSSDRITLIINEDFSRTFDLNAGENFFIVIKKENPYEKIIVSN